MLIYARCHISGSLTELMLGFAYRAIKVWQDCFSTLHRDTEAPSKDQASSASKAGNLRSGNIHRPQTQVRKPLSSSTLDSASLALAVLALPSPLHKMQIHILHVDFNSK